MAASMVCKSLSKIGLDDEKSLVPNSSARIIAQYNKSQMRPGCTLCAAEHLAALSQNPFGGVIRLQDFEAIWLNRDCSFCSLIQDIVKRACNVERVNQSLQAGQTIVCDLIWSETDAILYTTSGEVSPFEQLKVSIGKPTPRPEWEDDRDVRFYDRNTVLTSTGERDVRESISGYTGIRKSIDILDFKYRGDKYYDPLKLTRVIVPEKFDSTKLRDWLKHCEQNHDHGTRARTGGLKQLSEQNLFRLIDVKQHHIRLADAGERYMTLSYVCGLTIPNWVARDGMYANPGRGREQRRQLDLQSLPKTIREAIELTDEIGERFLWVDALCIDQKSPEDRKANIAAMDAIYYNSVLTILACKGDDGDTGLDGFRNPREERENIVSVQSGQTTLKLLPSRLPFRDLIEDEHSCNWNRRAWTYQEWLLSFRCVFFFKCEVFFSCPGEMLREGYELHQALPSHLAPRISTAKNWGTINDRIGRNQDLTFWDYAYVLDDYTSRNLAYPGDRKDAFEGLLNRFCSNKSRDASRDPRTLEASWSVPLSYMYDGLLWSAGERGAADLRRLRHNTASSQHFPSWSWVGWHGKIRYQMSWISKIEHRATQLKFTMIDESNIVGYPEGPGTICWQPWPPDINLCQTSIPGITTLHLWASAVPVRLKLPINKERFPFTTYSMYAREPDANTRDALLCRIRIDPSTIDKYGLDAPYEALYFGGEEAFAIVVIKVDAHHERVSLWCSVLFDDNWKKSWKSKYIRLQ